MGKSGNGPDMQDCSDYARLIGENVSCTVSILLEPVTRLDTSSWHVSVLAVSRELTPLGPVWSVCVTAHWPSRAYREFPAALYGALAQADAEIGKRAFTSELGLA